MKKMQEFLKEEWRKAQNIFGWTFVVLGVFLALVIRFAHPDLPDTRLFLDYSGLWILDIGFFVVAVYLFENT